MITGALWYMKNSMILEGLKFPNIRDKLKYRIRLTEHPNILARSMLVLLAHPKSTE